MEPAVRQAGEGTKHGTVPHPFHLRMGQTGSTKDTKESLPVSDPPPSADLHEAIDLEHESLHLHPTCLWGVQQEGVSLFQGEQRLISPPHPPGWARPSGSLSDQGGEPSAEWRGKRNVALWSLRPAIP
ncbi:unnamed protein product [Pleuronectes platessa]|uniref:Uncharacterized protein n=1 Tax=Pleuronectes platessa TaxID=8262 RepID=A0A9N7YZW6_PLEPL|nr:unnamed protein product [Pleuronectes platessa]